MEKLSKHEVAAIDKDYAEIFRKEKHDHAIVLDALERIRWEINPEVANEVARLGLVGYLHSNGISLDKNGEAIRKVYRDIGTSLSAYYSTFYCHWNNDKVKKYRYGKKK